MPSGQRARLVHQRLSPGSGTGSIPVGTSRLFVIQRDGIDAKLRQRVHLIRLRGAVVVCVLPESQRGKDCISAINQAVTVAAVLRLIKLSQGRKAVAVLRG